MHVGDTHRNRRVEQADVVDGLWLRPGPRGQTSVVRLSDGEVVSHHGSRDAALQSLAPAVDGGGPPAPDADPDTGSGEAIPNHAEGDPDTDGGEAVLDDAEPDSQPDTDDEVVPDNGRPEPDAAHTTAESPPTEPLSPEPHPDEPNPEEVV